MRDNHLEDCITHFNLPEEKDYFDIIGSIRFDEKTIRVFPLEGYVDEYLITGIEIISNIDKSLGYSEVVLKEWLSDFPVGGFHIDLPNKSIDFWMAKEAPGLTDMIRDKWQGWRVNWHKDNYEVHIEITEGKIIFEQPEAEKLIGHLRTILLGSSMKDGVVKPEHKWKEIILDKAIKELQ